MATSKSRTERAPGAKRAGPRRRGTTAAGTGVAKAASARKAATARGRKSAPARATAAARTVSRPRRQAAPARATAAVRAAKRAPAAAAGRALVVVESPTKSRTLAKFLGRGFTVMASNGHIMDLPKSRLGVDIEKDFEPEYVPIRSKGQALSRIKAAAMTATRIYLAPDPDREGEAIAWHLATALRSTRRPIQRLVFNEITQRAVQQALGQPRDLDLNLVNAQQARRVLDRLVGYKVSPFVWRTVRYGLSAGRVQSVALRLICEREEAIRAFVPEEFWTIDVDYQTAAGERFTARLVREDALELEQGQLRGDGAASRAQALALELARTEARVAGVETTPRQQHPRAPFITSTLQQAAFNRLGFSSQRTMKIAQQLYEGVALGPQGSVGLITYMRTDSPRLAGEAIAEMRRWLAETLGPEYVPESPNQYRSKKSAQGAHEAIRPTGVERTPDAVRPFLSGEQFRLYDLIWKRAVASQATPAEYLATTVEVEAGRLGLRATGRVLRFAGFQRLYGLEEEDELGESRLPELSAGQPLAVAREPLVQAAGEAGPAGVVRPEQHFTQPPPRYTEGSLVKALEEEDIGRPSTYATIVGTITSREYVAREKGRLAPTDLGMAVNRLLVSTFPDVFTVNFTAAMEEELDEIEEGKQEWHRVVHDFWGPFSKDLAQAEKARHRHRRNVEETTDIACPNCGRMLVKKFGRRGPFLACPGYPECRYTRPVDDAELPTPVEGKCEKCGASLVARNGPYGRYISCVRRPECDYTRPFTLGVKCPECGQGEIAEKRSRRGKLFYSCSRYPDCKFAIWDRPQPTPCPSCAAPFLVEKRTRKGAVLRCVRPGCGYRSAPQDDGA